jgi:hypothetical protein
MLLAQEELQSAEAQGDANLGALVVARQFGEAKLFSELHFLVWPVPGSVDTRLT